MHRAEIHAAHVAHAHALHQILAVPIANFAHHASGIVRAGDIFLAKQPRFEFIWVAAESAIYSIPGARQAASRGVVALHAVASQVAACGAYSSANAACESLKSP